MPKPYEILTDRSAIRCNTCGQISHNPNDVFMKYCGNCHVFHEQGNICDFCNRERPLIFNVIAKSRFKGKLNDGRIVVDGDQIWGACADCAFLIQEGIWNELLEKSVDGYIASCDGEIPKFPVNREATKQHMNSILQIVFGENFNA